MTLELSNVSITLGGRQLVKGLDLKLAPGEVVGLLGPNGAGKTTTFNLVIGLLSPDQGEVTVNGEGHPAAHAGASPAWCGLPAPGSECVSQSHGA